MELLDSERGQAVQVGAILLFGFLVIGLSLYQATVVPQQTKATEFGAYLDASDDLVSLHNDVLATATRGVQSGVTVQTGVQYRPRVVFINPGPPTGSLALTDSRDVTIAGVDAVDGEPEAVRTLWDGGARTYESKVLRYSPSYNEFDGTPITVSGASVQREAGANVVPLGGQTLVSGNRITVVSVDGRIGQTAARTPLTVAPISSAARTVTVTNESDEDISLTVPVGSNATAWSRSPTADRLLENVRVKAVSDLGDGADPTNSLVRVTLNGSYTYELRLAKVELSSSSAASTVASPDGQYLVPVTTGASAAPGESTGVVVEARDGYNNPVEGERIDFTVTEGDASPTSRTITTTDDGRAGFAFTPAGDADGPITVRASGDLDGDGTVEAIEQTTYTVPLVNGSGGGGGTGAGDDGSTGEINPPNDYEGDVVLEGASEVGPSNEVEIRLNNTGDTRTITSFRVSFHYPDSNNKFASGVEFNGSPEQPIGGQQYTLGSNAVTLQGNQTTPVSVTFAPSGVNANGDFFILTVQFDDGEFATYFVAVP
ncbi:hypothetical protein C5C07_11655 [Haloferax sp. Atlit-4N]|uniref:hypothetical protein n=1 Tax=Haloferax sp. Atlit-4N TaxID=2077206 RepID=UPI000E272D0B|nr:hypothetical protein [Haloferax sp. Atlit-4N]RDZ52431.1 hypothetical protein C5C07_11655 [Haloferax sp. Atlit-4N]